MAVLLIVEFSVVILNLALLVGLPFRNKRRIFTIDGKMG